MATSQIDMVQGGTTGFPCRDYLHTVGVMSRYLDLSKATSIRGSALTGQDEIQLIQLPAGTMVLAGACEVLTTSNTATSFSVFVSGDTSKNTIIDGGSLGTTGFLGAGTNGNLSYRRDIGSGGAIISGYIKATTATLATGIVRVDIVVAEAQTGNLPSQAG